MAYNNDEVVAYNYLESLLMRLVRLQNELVSTLEIMLYHHGIEVELWRDKPGKNGLQDKSVVTAM